MKKISISNLLILISIVITAFMTPFPGLVNYGMNSYYLYSNDFIGMFIQFCLYQFLHGGVLHLLSNSLFILIFGNQVESMMGTKRYLIFFIMNTAFTGAAILIFATGITIGISGFAMAILGYIFMELKRLNHPDYKGAGLFLIINVLIGFAASISLIGHLAGAIFGILFYYLVHAFYRRI